MVTRPFEDQRAGFTWGGNRGWINPTAVTRGTYLLPGVGMPTDYDPNQDTYRAGVNGTQESAMQRAYRWANDLVEGGKTTNYQNALAYAMANLSSDWQRGQNGQQPDWTPANLGWDATALRYNQYGEAYNDEIDYANPTVKYVNGQPVVASTGTPSGGNTARGRNPLAGPTAPPPVAPAATPPPVVTPPVVTPPPVATTPVTGGLTAAQKAALAEDPEQAYRYMMQQLGYSVDAPGMLGKFLRGKFEPLLEARMSAGGLQAGGESSYLDTIDQIIRGFGTGMVAPGGAFFGGLANTANQAMQQGRGYLDTLSDQGQAIQYGNQMAMLRTAGMNPLIQQASADQGTRAKNQYQDFSFNNELAGKNIDPFTQWLMTQPGYRSVFGY